MPVISFLSYDWLHDKHNVILQTYYKKVEIQLCYIPVIWNKIMKLPDYITLKWFQTLQSWASKLNLPINYLEITIVGSGSIPGHTNIQGLKIIEKVLPFP